MLKNSERGDLKMSSVDLAIKYAREAVNAESRGHGDVDDAMHRLSAKTGIGYWTWWGLWNRRRKGVNDDLLRAVQGVYLAVCQRQVSRLQLAIETEAAKKDAQENDPFEDLAREAEALVEKIHQARLKKGLIDQAAPPEAGAR